MPDLATNPISGVGGVSLSGGARSVRGILTEGSGADSSGGDRGGREEEGGEQPPTGSNLGGALGGLAGINIYIAALVAATKDMAAASVAFSVATINFTLLSILSVLKLLHLGFICGVTLDTDIPAI